MKILAVGDFHGKFPRKFHKIIKKNKIDLVLSMGDYLPFHYRKIWFKHCFATDKELWEFIGKKKYRELVIEDFRRGEIPLKRLNKLQVPVFTVLGNIDYPESDDVSDMRSSDLKSKKNNAPNWEKKDLFAKKLKKYPNIKRIDYSYAKFWDYVFIGMRGHSFPGHVKSRAYKRHRAKLDKLFRKFKKENKNKKVIFVSHIMPYKTKLDKITDKEADKRVKGKHYGSKLTRRIIERYQPILAIGGHFHKNIGKQKLGKTLIINPGDAGKGRYAVVDISDKGKVKVKFGK